MLKWNSSAAVYSTASVSGRQTRRANNETNSLLIVAQWKKKKKNTTKLQEKGERFSLWWIRQNDFSGPAVLLLLCLFHGRWTSKTLRRSINKRGECVSCVTLDPFRTPFFFIFIIPQNTQTFSSPCFILFLFFASFHKFKILRMEEYSRRNLKRARPLFDDSISQRNWQINRPYVQSPFFFWMAPLSFFFIA